MASEDVLDDARYAGFDASTEHFKKYFDLGTNTDSIKTFRSNCIKSAGSGSVKGGLGGSYIYAKKSVDRHSFLQRTQISLSRVLQCRPVLLMFYKYLDLRLATEALLFWLDVESFQNMNWKPIRILGINDEEQEQEQEQKIERKAKSARRFSQAEIEKEARRIFSTYLSTQARKEVCVSPSVVENVVNNLKDVKGNCFREAQREVFRDLEKGSFQEFLSCLSKEGIKAVEEYLKEYAPSPGLATYHAMKYKTNSIEFKTGEFRSSGV